MTKMSLSHDEAGAADRQPFVWCRGRMDRTACLGRGLRPARPGLDGQAAGWQGSCRPPTGSGAAARKGWAARSPGGEPARLGPRAGLEAQTGTVTRPPPSPGRTGEQVGSLGRGLVLSAGGGGGPGRGSFPHAWPFLSSRLCPWKRKRRSPRSLSAGNKELAAGRGRALTHVPRQEPPRQAGDMPAVGLVTGSRLMQCARTAMTIKGSLHPLPAERWHCGLEHPPGLSVMMGSGYPEKQVLALFSAERTPPPQPFSTRPSLPALARGSCVWSPGSPLQWPSLARGRGPWGGGRAAPWDGGTGRLLPFSQRLELDTRCEDIVLLTLSRSHGMPGRGGAGAQERPPGKPGGVLGPGGGRPGFGTRAAPRRGRCHPGDGRGGIGRAEAAARPGPPPPAGRRQGRRGRGQRAGARRHPGVSPAPRVLTAPGDDDSAAVHFTRV